MRTFFGLCLLISVIAFGLQRLHPKANESGPVKISDLLYISFDTFPSHKLVFRATHPTHQSVAQYYDPVKVRYLYHDCGLLGSLFGGVWISKISARIVMNIIRVPGEGSFDGIGAIVDFGCEEPILDFFLMETSEVIRNLIMFPVADIVGSYWFFN